MAIYLDACATAPPAAEVLAAMAEASAKAWANPSSLHGLGWAAAECLERSRAAIAAELGAVPQELVFTSGGSESVHLALLGLAERWSGPAAGQPPRLVISALEHPAVEAAAASLARRGWSLARWPVDGCGRLLPDWAESLLAPPTRLVSLIWGQSEVGSLQAIESIGAQCRGAGIPLHLDAVQVVGHQLIDWARLPADLLSFTAHKIQGPRGIGALLLRPGLEPVPQIGGGGQERGLRAGTEPVVLAAGFAAALALCQQRLHQHGGRDPLARLRDPLLAALLALPGVELSGPDPRQSLAPERLPHHISLTLADRFGRALSGRALVQALWRQGIAASSGSACAGGGNRPAPSPVLLAMGYGAERAASGLRLSLGPWLQPADLAAVPDALARAQAELEAR
jgi:cysteine desulfurase